MYVFISFTSNLKDMHKTIMFLMQYLFETIFLSIKFYILKFYIILLFPSGSNHSLKLWLWLSVISEKGFLMETNIYPTTDWITWMKSALKSSSYTSHDCLTQPCKEHWQPISAWLIRLTWMFIELAASNNHCFFCAFNLVPVWKFAQFYWLTISTFPVKAITFKYTNSACFHY